jgi:hypothetical protein
MHARSVTSGTDLADSTALSMVWLAALGVLVPNPSMRPFVSLSCSRKDDRLASKRLVLGLVHVRDTTHFGWLRHAAAKSCSPAPQRLS